MKDGKEIYAYALPFHIHTFTFLEWKFFGLDKLQL